MSTNLMTVSNQWASRPDDQRYLTLDDLHAAVQARRDSSVVTDVALEHLQVMPADDTGESPMMLLAPGQDREMRPLGQLTHYTFGQLATKVGAPAGYLRSLPPILAASAMQWSLEQRGLQGEDAKVLARVNGSTMVAGVNSPTYGRIWDAQITGPLAKYLDRSKWKVPAASYAARDPKRATTLYASDRDVFVFLVNESVTIEVPGEGPKYRGFYVSNSEVGDGKLDFATFLYDYVCDNRIVWGATSIEQISIRHTSGAPMRFIAQVEPQLTRVLAASSANEVNTIKAAQSKVLGKDKGEVVSWLRQRGFSEKMATTAYNTTEQEGVRNPRSLWGAISGLTGAAKDIPHTNDRMKVEKKASELLDSVREFA